MPLRLDATLELSDDQLAQIAARLDLDRPQRLASSPSTPSQAAGELPDAWLLVEERHGVTYAWPEGIDTYDPFRVYEGTVTGGSIRLAIGECERTMVRGEKRRYFITGQVAPRGAFRPIAEFLATDDHDETAEMIAIIKGKDGKGRMYDPRDELPDLYDGFKIETYRDRIDKPHSYSKLGVVAAEDDVDAMLGHTFIQAVTRLRIPLD